MFCRINYSVDKEYLRKYFFKNFHRTSSHKTQFGTMVFWKKLFDFPKISDPIIDDLGLTRYNILPRFSFQLRNTRLPEHIDIDRIVGININLTETPAIIHLNGNPYSYECCLVDVGSVLHSVEPTPDYRLILKLAIREPWEIIYSTLKEKNLLIDNIPEYKSILDPDMKKYIR